jgi:hypothetical protein
MSAQKTEAIGAPKLMVEVVSAAPPIYFSGW